MARKCKSILYLSKIMLTTPQRTDFVFSSKIISTCGIQRASENILPGSYPHQSKRQFYNWISPWRSNCLFVRKHFKGLSNRVRHNLTCDTTKYAAYEFSVPFLWQTLSCFNMQGWAEKNLPDTSFCRAGSFGIKTSIILQWSLHV